MGWLVSLKSLSPHERLLGRRRVSNPSTSIDPGSLKIVFLVLIRNAGFVRDNGTITGYRGRNPVAKKLGRPLNLFLLSLSLLSLSHKTVLQSIYKYVYIHIHTHTHTASHIDNSANFGENLPVQNGTCAKNSTGAQMLRWFVQKNGTQHTISRKHVTQNWLFDANLPQKKKRLIIQQTICTNNLEIIWWLDTQFGHTIW